jgi:hypothetical protein
MQKIERKLVVKDVVESTLCNKCGEDCYGEGLPETEIVGGFQSSVLGDNSRYSFALCEDCLWDLFKTFKIKPIDSSDDQDVEEYESWVAGGQQEYTTRLREDPDWRAKTIKESRYMINHLLEQTEKEVADLLGKKEET